METINSTLKQQWADLRTKTPHLRIRNAAEELGVSEAHLLATQIGENVILLKPEFQNILGEIEPFGKVMALTRNDDVVHERKGIYLNPSLKSPVMGLFVGADIDLRIFFQPWKFAFAVTEGEQDKPRFSLQFFGSDGEAIHKIYLTPDSNVEKYHELVEKYKSDDQKSDIETTPWIVDTKELKDEEIDVEAFRNEWINLKDTHDFFGLLKKHNLTRTQALRLAPKGNYAVKVKNSALRYALTQASARGIEIMVFVGNKGMIQIHTGLVEKIVDHTNWLNVLDPDFNLHVKEDSIIESWVVRKPTEDGVVTALELFNSKGEQIAQLFGKRKPGIPELESWQNLITDLEIQEKLFRI